MPKVEGYEESCERYVAVSLMAPLRLSALPGYRFGLKSRVGQWQVARRLENFVNGPICGQGEGLGFCFESFA